MKINAVFKMADNYSSFEHLHKKIIQIVIKKHCILKKKKMTMKHNLIFG